MCARSGAWVRTIEHAPPIGSPCLGVCTHRDPIGGAWVRMDIGGLLRGMAHAGGARIVHGGRLLDPTATLEAAGLGDGMCVFAMVRAQLDPSRCACSPRQGPTPRAIGSPCLGVCTHRDPISPMLPRAGERD
eukprot:COSAG01_NODE_7946_length_2980_cov_1.936133_3_plen_132_part_00